MGEVYVARASGGELVALKLLLADEGSPLSARFEREGRLAVQLEHPHIVAARESGRAPDGTPYIAMELLAGIDLDTHLHNTGVLPREALAIAIQVCDALEYAHGKGVIHRDLKPQNIFLCRAADVAVKVLDFGIARLAGDAGMTATGMMIGTLAYMSPEQARGQRDLDARADIWSLGVVLYQMLSGRLPFSGAEGPAMLFQLLFEPHTELPSALPKPLIAIVNRTLKKQRDERFPSAAAMKSALLSIDPNELVTGVAPTVAFDSSAQTLAAEEGAILTDERRLTSLVYCRRPRDLARIEAMANEASARMFAVEGGDVMALFGVERWTEDEPNRAARFALSVASFAEGVGVSTGRVLRSGVAIGSTVMRTAARLSADRAVTLDATTAELLRGKFGLDWQEDGTAKLTTHVVGSIPPSPLLIGRDLELAMLARTIDTAVSESTTRAVVIVGAPGMGKTQLRRQALRAAHERHPDLTTLIARCDPFRRDTPFSTLRETIANAAGKPDAVQSLSRAIAGAFTQTDVGDAVAVLDRVRTKVLSGLEAVAEHGPILIVIDAAQWQDPPSAASLGWILETSPDLPLAIWLLGRPEGRESMLGIAPSAAQIDLGPLTREAAAELVTAIAGSAPTALLDRAGGHPLFLEELARLLFERGPASLRGELVIPVSIEAALVAQLDALETLQREALKRAAIFGQVWWMEGLQQLGADADSVQRLRRSNLIAPRPRSRFAGAKELTFRNAMMADVAYTLWTDEQRGVLHGLAGAWLAAQSGVAPDELARHFDLAGDPRAADYHLAAAEASARVADIETTCAHVERVLALTTDPLLRFKANVARDDALQTTSDFDRRRAGITEMTELAEKLGMVYAAEAAWRRCHLARLVSDRSALVFGLRAVELATLAHDPRSGAAAERELAMLLSEEGEHEQAREHAIRSRELAEQAGDPWLTVRALSTLAFVLGEAGALSASLSTHAEAAERYATLGDQRREAQARTNAANALLELGRIEEAIPQIEACITASDRVGNARVVAVSTHNLGVARRLRGELDAAEELQVRVAPEAERLRHNVLRASVAIERVYLALARNAAGELLADEAMRAADAARSNAWTASATAVALRAHHRAGHEVASLLKAARDLVPTLDRAAARVELLAAIAEVDPSAKPELDAAVAATNDRALMTKKYLL
jgi:eukaryotic-like serine/threonine-protein kinase